MSWMPDVSQFEKHLQEARERQAKAKSSGRSLKGAYLDITDGRNRVRLLPPWRSPDHPLYNHPPFIEVVDHVRVPHKNGRHRCLRLSYSKELLAAKNLTCEICDMIDRLREEGIIESARDLGQRPRNQRTYYTNALDLDGDASTPKILGLRSTAYMDVMGGITEALYEEDNILDAKAGANLTIKRTGKDKDTRYSATFSRSSTPIADTDEEIAAILDQLWDLDRIYKIPNDEKLAAAKVAAQEMYEYYKENPPTGFATSASAPTTSASKTELDVSARSTLPPCFSNHNPALPACLDCHAEISCRAENEKTGGDPNKPSPEEVASGEVTSDMPF